MLITSEVYERFLNKTSGIIYKSLKDKEYLYFEKSMLESDPLVFKSAFAARPNKSASSFYCAEKGKIKNIRYRKNITILENILDLMQQNISSLQEIIKPDFEKRNIHEITHLLYCFLVDMLSKNIVYTSVYPYKIGKFDKVTYNNKIFKKDSRMDALEKFLRTLIWKNIKRNLPLKMPLWKLRKNLITLIRENYVTHDKKIVLVIFEDKRGKFFTYMPIDFVERFFKKKDLNPEQNSEIKEKDLIVYFPTEEGVFKADLSKSFPLVVLTQEIDRKVMQLKTIEQKFNTSLDKEIQAQFKEKRKVCRQISYMLKICEIYDEVITDIKRYPLLNNRKAIPFGVLKLYLNKILFHLPYKKSREFSKELIEKKFYNLLLFFKSNS